MTMSEAADRTFAEIARLATIPTDKSSEVRELIRFAVDLGKREGWDEGWEHSNNDGWLGDNPYCRADGKATP